jgi:hypothetical protein
LVPTDIDHDIVVPLSEMLCMEPDFSVGHVPFAVGSIDGIWPVPPAFAPVDASPEAPLEEPLDAPLDAPLEEPCPEPPLEAMEPLDPLDPLEPDAASLGPPSSPAPLPEEAPLELAPSPLSRPEPVELPLPQATATAIASNAESEPILERWPERELMVFSSVRPGRFESSMQIREPTGPRTFRRTSGDEHRQTHWNEAKTALASWSHARVTVLYASCFYHPVPRCRRALVA